MSRREKSVGKQPSLKDTRFPRWTAPFVGAGLGAFLAARIARNQGHHLSTEWLIGGIVLGALFGVVIWVFERPKPAESRGDQDKPR